MKDEDLDTVDLILILIRVNKFFVDWEIYYILVVIFRTYGGKKHGQEVCVFR